METSPPQTTSLYIVASTDARGRMHIDGKPPYLGGFAHPPSCTPNHKKIAPPKKNSADARVPEDVGPRRVASLHPYGMVRLPMPGGGRSTKEGGRTNGLMVGFWRHPICNKSPQCRKRCRRSPRQPNRIVPRHRLHPQGVARLPVPGVRCPMPAWGRTEGHHGGGLVRKKTDLSLEPGSYRRTWYKFYGMARKAR